MNRIDKPVLALLFTFFLFKSLSAQVLLDEATELKGIDVVEHLGDTIPLDLRFINDAGDTLALREYFSNGKPAILTLGYYSCPMLCTMVLNGLTDALKGLELKPGRDYQMLTISINPKETAELAQAKRKTYLNYFDRAGSAEGWRFFVGDSLQSRTLADALGFIYYYDEKNNQYAHPAVVFILTEKGVISRYLYGLAYKPNDMRLALLEASEGRIGNTIERLILFCYHYDPSEKGYVLFAGNLMRLGGLVVMLALAFLLATLWLKERRRKTAGLHKV